MQILVSQVSLLLEKFGVFDPGVVESLKVLDATFQLLVKVVVFFVFPDDAGGFGGFVHLASFAAQALEGSIQDFGKVRQLSRGEESGLGVHKVILIWRDTRRGVGRPPPTPAVVC